MKVIILGANGQLGTDLQKVFVNEDVVAVGHSALNICDKIALFDLLHSIKPDVVFNTAAFHNTDKCEIQPDLAFAVNAVAVGNLARLCEEIYCQLVHFSTDYVFAGNLGRSLTEADVPNPINVYGVSKLAGEFLIKNATARYFIIRTSGLFGLAGSGGKGGNFVEKMLEKSRNGDKWSVVNDQIFSPTFTQDLAETVAQLIRYSIYGTYHITNKGFCSWFDLAVKAISLCGLKNKPRPSKTNYIPGVANRPMFSVLESERKPFFRPLRNWQEALKDYLEQKGYINE